VTSPLCSPSSVTWFRGEDGACLFSTRFALTNSEGSVRWNSEALVSTITNDQDSFALSFEIKEQDNTFEGVLIDSVIWRLDSMEWSPRPGHYRSESKEYIVDLPQGGCLRLYVFKETSSLEHSGLGNSQLQDRKGTSYLDRQ